jgi:DnaJ C terminal domain
MTELTERQTWRNPLRDALESYPAAKASLGCEVHNGGSTGTPAGWGEDKLMAGGSSGGPAWEPDFSESFDEFFGTGPGGPRPGKDVTVSLELPAAEASVGVTKNLTVPMPVECRACTGSGAEPGSDQVRCQACGGSGAQQRAGRRGITQLKCQSCYGAGSIPSRACPACQGEGRVAGERTIRIAIPAGVAYGARLRVPGKGGAARRGGPHGDLYIQIGAPPDDRPRLSQDIVIHNPASRSVARILFAAAWLVLGLYLTLAHPDCTVQGSAAGCRTNTSSFGSFVLVTTVPLLIAAGASAYAHVVLGAAGVRLAGLRALVLRRSQTYGWADIDKVAIVTTSHKWTFFTVYVARHVDLKVRGKYSPIRLPAPRAGMLVSERQFREKASVIHRTWLEQTGQAGSADQTWTKR